MHNKHTGSLKTAYNKGAFLAYECVQAGETYETSVSIANEKNTYKMDYARANFMEGFYTELSVRGLLPTQEQEPEPEQEHTIYEIGYQYALYLTESAVTEDEVNAIFDKATKDNPYTTVEEKSDFMYGVHRCLVETIEKRLQHTELNGETNT